jgi:hypothetical protein
MQTASLKTPSSPLTAVVKAVAATVMIGLCVAIFPVVPVLVPLMALPVAHVVARWGVPLGALVTVTATALIYVGIGISAATLMFLLLTGVGMVLGQALGKGRPFARTFALMVVAAFVAFILWGLVVWLALGVDLTGLKEAAYTSIDDAAATYQQLGMSQATAAAASDQMRGLIDVIPYLAPGLAGMVSILLAACSLALADLSPAAQPGGDQLVVRWFASALGDRVRIDRRTGHAAVLGRQRDLARSAAVCRPQSFARFTDPVLHTGSRGGAVVRCESRAAPGFTRRHLHRSHPGADAAAHRAGGTVRYLGGLSQAFCPEGPQSGLDG